MKYLALFFIAAFSVGCIPWFPWENIDDHIQAQKAANPMGCGFVKGGGNPPASRLDGGTSFGWGEEMSVEQMNLCLEKLKALP